MCLWSVSGAAPNTRRCLSRPRCVRRVRIAPKARASLAKTFDFTNHDRRHQGLMDRQTPWQAYTGVSLGQAA